MIRDLRRDILALPGFAQQDGIARAIQNLGHSGGNRARLLRFEYKRIPFWWVTASGLLPPPHDA